MLATRTHHIEESPFDLTGSARVYRTLCGTRVSLTGSPDLLHVDSDRRGGLLQRAAPGEVPTCRRCFARLPPHGIPGAAPATAAVGRAV